MIGIPYEICLKVLGVGGAWVHLLFLLLSTYGC